MELLAVVTGRLLEAVLGDVYLKRCVDAVVARNPPRHGMILARPAEQAGGFYNQEPDRAGREIEVDVPHRSELAPLLAPPRILPRSGADLVEIGLDDSLPGFAVIARVRTSGQTGPCLTLFDMLEAIHRTMEIGAIRVVAKAGGRSGEGAG